MDCSLLVGNTISMADYSAACRLLLVEVNQLLSEFQPFLSNDN